MCPMCIPTVMLVAASVATTCGVATGLIRRFGVKKVVDHPFTAPPSKPVEK